MELCSSIDKKQEDLEKLKQYKEYSMWCIDEHYLNDTEQWHFEPSTTENIVDTNFFRDL